MARRRTHDLFDGVYDNASTGRREVWQDGEVKRYAARNCCGDEASPFDVLHEAWGAYPDLPTNAATIAA